MKPIFFPLHHWLTGNATSPSCRAQGFLSFPSRKKHMLFEGCIKAIKLHYRLRQAVFWEEKCKSNAQIKSGLNNWISGERQRRRRKEHDYAFLSIYTLWGWDEGRVNNKKAARTVQNFHGPPGPQLPHLHKPCLMPAGTSGDGLGAIPQTRTSGCALFMLPFCKLHTWW